MEFGGQACKTAQINSQMINESHTSKITRPARDRARDYFDLLGSLSWKQEMSNQIQQLRHFLTDKYQYKLVCFCAGKPVH